MMVKYYLAMSYNECQNVLVTGGLGFLGYHLIRRLIGIGHKVRIIDNMSGSHLLQNKVHESLNVSIIDVRALEYIITGVKTVFHLADCHFGFPDNHLFLTNINGTKNVLDVARKVGVDRVIMASDAVSVSETKTVIPQDSYHLSKQVCEFYMQNYYNWYGLKTITLRFTELFGPNQNPNRYIIPKLVNSMRDNSDISLTVRPRYSRDFCYVDNAVDALVSSMNAKLSGEIVNIGSGECNTITTLSKSIERLVKGPMPDIKIGKTNSPYVYTGKVSIELAKNLLGYKPRIGFEAGLRRYISSFPQGKKQ